MFSLFLKRDAISGRGRFDGNQPRTSDESFGMWSAFPKGIPSCETATASLPVPLLYLGTTPAAAKREAKAEAFGWHFSNEPQLT